MTRYCLCVVHKIGNNLQELKVSTIETMKCSLTFVVHIVDCTVVHTGHSLDQVHQDHLVPEVRDLQALLDHLRGPLVVAAVITIFPFNKQLLKSQSQVASY